LAFRSFCGSLAEGGSAFDAEEGFFAAAAVLEARLAGVTALDDGSGAVGAASLSSETEKASSSTLPSSSSDVWLAEESSPDAGLLLDADNRDAGLGRLFAEL
jgi:hypothetical protein